jgi:hypothetical protein
MHSTPFIDDLKKHVTDECFHLDMYLFSSYNARLCI